MRHITLSMGIGKKMARPEGFEPPTTRGRNTALCPLSYGRA
jgi:hypothetical protein